MELLAVNHAILPDAVVVHAKGDVDTGTVGELSCQLTTARELALTHSARLVVVDLRAVTFFGSAGLNALLICRERCAAVGTSLRLVADNAVVVRPIEITNLDRVLAIYPTLTDAVRPSPD